MRRILVEPRPNARRLVQSQGLVFSEANLKDGTDTYWPDDRYYSFTSEEVELLEQAGQEVFDMCCEATDYLLAKPDMITSKMGIPPFALQQISDSWEREPAWGSVLGRFDICFGGLDHPDARLRVPKFYEFNADTPTLLLESAVIQQLWLMQTGHGQDQFNGISDRLVSAWRRNLELIEAAIGHRPRVHFAVSRADRTGEDALNTSFLLGTCEEAGYETKTIYMERIRLGTDGRFYDQNGEHIDVIFKLYPWEDMMDQPFARACMLDMARVGERDEAGKYVGGTVWIEPPYKMLWSNKAIFAILWELFRHDPRGRWLLPTYFEADAPASLTSYARKPLFSREGHAITLQDGATVLSQVGGAYLERGGFVRQQLCKPPTYEDSRTGCTYNTVLGLWMIDGEVSGLGVREDKELVTRNNAVFVPNSICDGPLLYERMPIPDEDEINETLSLEKCMASIGLNSSVLDYIDDVVKSVRESEVD